VPGDPVAAFEPPLLVEPSGPVVDGPDGQAELVMIRGNRRTDCVEKRRAVALALAVGGDCQLREIGRPAGSDDDCVSHGSLIDGDEKRERSLPGRRQYLGPRFRQCS